MLYVMYIFCPCSWLQGHVLYFHCGHKWQLGAAMEPFGIICFCTKGPIEDLETQALNVSPVSLSQFWNWSFSSLFFSVANKRYQKIIPPASYSSFMGFILNPLSPLFQLDISQDWMLTRVNAQHCWQPNRGRFRYSGSEKEKCVICQEAGLRTKGENINLMASIRFDDRTSGMSNYCCLLCLYRYPFFCIPIVHVW